MPDKVRTVTIPLKIDSYQPAGSEQIEADLFMSDFAARLDLENIDPQNFKTKNVQRKEIILAGDKKVPIIEFDLICPVPPGERKLSVVIRLTPIITSVDAEMRHRINRLGEPSIKRILAKSEVPLPAHPRGV